MKNFQVAANSGPQIGDHYSRIYDMMVGDTFYDCVIIPIHQLTFYEDLIQAYAEDGLDIGDLAFGIRYRRYSDDMGDVESYEDEDDSYGETSFIVAELDDILFQK